MYFQTEINQPTQTLRLYTGFSGVQFHSPPHGGTVVPNFPNLTYSVLIARARERAHPVSPVSFSPIFVCLNFLSFPGMPGCHSRHHTSIVGCGEASFGGGLQLEHEPAASYCPSTQHLQGPLHKGGGQDAEDRGDQEGEGQEPNVKHFIPNQYPSSSASSRNWDKVMGDISEEEKKEKQRSTNSFNKSTVTALTRSNGP